MLQAEDEIQDAPESRGLGEVYKRKGGSEDEGGGKMPSFIRRVVEARHGEGQKRGRRRRKSAEFYSSGGGGLSRRGAAAKTKRVDKCRVLFVGWTYLMHT